MIIIFFFFQAEDGIRDVAVTGVQTCALPISKRASRSDSCGAISQNEAASYCTTTTPGCSPAIPVFAYNTASTTRAGPSPRSAHSSKVVGRYGPTVVPEVSREEPPKRATPISTPMPHWAEDGLGAAARPTAIQVAASVRIVPPALGVTSSPA